MLRFFSKDRSLDPNDEILHILYRTAQLTVLGRHIVKGNDVLLSAQPSFSLEFLYALISVSETVPCRAYIPARGWKQIWICL